MTDNRRLWGRFHPWQLRQKPSQQIALTLIVGVLVLLSLVTGCSLPQVKAEDRIFLNLSLDFLGEYRLPPESTFAETPVGGLSGITYDRQLDRFYAISDDRSNFAPARFYTLKLILDNPNLEVNASEDANNPSGMRLDIEQVTPLTDETGAPFAQGSVDLEGIALSPRRSLFISSEGAAASGISPFINEFDLETGKLLSRLPIPDRYLPKTLDDQTSGVQDNRAFESLTLNPGNYGTTQLEPFRLFTATEAPLQQDLPAQDSPSDSSSNDASEPASPGYVRLAHYLIGEDLPTLLSEHLYPLKPMPEGATESGLTELISLDQGGHFLGLERSFGLLSGFGIEIFQLAMGGATDVSSIPAIQGNASGITPIYKRSLLDLSNLGIPLDNLEGMTLGPQLPDGTQSLLLVSDDNFNALQQTQFLLFRIRGLR